MGARRFVERFVVRFLPWLPWVPRSVEAVAGKLSAIATGSARVSLTCQIPSIREKYAALGLPPRSGVFVEVGAYNGESYSNTSFLADQGWRGIYVEPVPYFSKQTQIRHLLNNVAVENVAIGDAAGTATISVMGGLSTLSRATADAYHLIDWAKSSAAEAKPLNVAMARLEDVLVRNGVPDRFDLLVVDVEGCEEPIIGQLFASRWRPRVMIIELVDMHPDFGSTPELQQSAKRVRELILAHRYTEAYSDSINSIFRAE